MRQVALVTLLGSRRKHGVLIFAPPIRTTSTAATMPDKPRVYRVLVRGPERSVPGGTIQQLELVEVTEAQYLAYIGADPEWRSARGPGDAGWWGRAWRRIAGRRDDA
jgi:hypothetical protein